MDSKSLLHEKYTAQDKHIVSKEKTQGTREIKEIVNETNSGSVKLQSFLNMTSNTTAEGQTLLIC